MTTLGIGGSTIEAELNAIVPRTNTVTPIKKEEFQCRIDKAVDFMKRYSIKAMYLHAGTNLFYFTGTKWHSSERIRSYFI